MVLEHQFLKKKPLEHPLNIVKACMEPREKVGVEIVSREPVAIPYR